MTEGRFDAGRGGRYGRQLLLPAIGKEGQARLANAQVRVVGAGADAAPGLIYLAAAGVGTIWVDAPEVVTATDAGCWLYETRTTGEARAGVAVRALRERTSLVRLEEGAEEAVPNAVLVLSSSTVAALAAAERARKAGVPLVVGQSDGEGGTVVSVPVGAPCFTCARPVGGASRPLSPGIGALGALAAAELIFILVDPNGSRGRRIDLVRGVPSMRPTVRLAGCACGGGVAG